LTLSLSRDFGYGGFNGDIQGLFTLQVSGSASLARVVFYIDNTQLGESTHAPFDLQFNTDTYPLGIHTLYAIGYTADGRTLYTQTISARFVSASEGMRTALGIAIPLVVVIFGAILLSAVFSTVFARREGVLVPGAKRNYALGGAVCPNCRRPFGLHLYGLNLVIGKLDRCPYCGKWSLVRRASAEALQEAEQAELSGDLAQAIPSSAEEEARRALDESKFRDL